MANGAPMPGIQIKVTLNVIMYPGIGDLWHSSDAPLVPIYQDNETVAGNSGVQSPECDLLEQCSQYKKNSQRLKCENITSGLGYLTC